MKWSDIKAAIDEQIAAKGWVDAEIEWIDWSEAMSSGAPSLSGKEECAFLQ